jgi:hypothetical protein
MAFGEVLREFGVKVTLAFDGKKIDAAADKIDKFGEKLRGFALGVTGATAGLYEFQNLFTTNARSLQNQAQILGINTEKLQEYEYAAKVAGDVNRDELVDSLHKLGDTMDQARAGNIDARRSLEQLGAMSGKTGLIISRLNDPTYKVTDAFHDMAGGIQAISKNSPLAASRIVEQTLGNAKLYNVLREGPKVIDANLEAGKKNFALNDKMIAQGAEVDKQMSKLWMTFRKFGYEIGYSVMKHLAPMIVQFTKWFAANKKMIASGINIFLDRLADALEQIFKTGVQVVRWADELVDALGGGKNAIDLLIKGFLIFQGISLAVSFGKMAVAIGSLVASLAPLAVYVVPLVAIAGAIHDLYVVATGGSYEDTWIAKLNKGIDELVEKMPGMKTVIGWRDKANAAITDVWHKMAPKSGGIVANAENAVANIKPIWQQMGPKPAYAGASYGPPPGPSSGNTFNTTNNIAVPPGTKAADAAHMISKATVDSHEKILMKAKLDAARSKQY